MSFRRFIVWRPESGQNEKDGIMVHAYCAEEAVERWARHNDYQSLDFQIANGQPAKVMVRDLNTRTVNKWIVSGKSVTQYHASRITPEEPK